MGIQKEESHVAPDTYGLPEYRVTKILKQRVGDDIHFLCGHERFGQTYWLYVMTMKASDVVVEARECEDIAREALNGSGTRWRAQRH